jgi:hypothetical protein
LHTDLNYNYNLTRLVRDHSGQTVAPTASIMDSQSVKTSTNVALTIRPARIPLRISFGGDGPLPGTGAGGWPADRGCMGWCRPRGRRVCVFRWPRFRRESPMNGWLMWGLVLPILLVVAGIVTFRRRKGRR